MIHKYSDIDIGIRIIKELVESVEDEKLNKLLLKLADAIVVLW